MLSFGIECVMFPLYLKYETKSYSKYLHFIHFFNALLFI